MNGMRKRFGSRIDFVRLDVSTPTAKELMSRWRVRLNSTYLIFDAGGQEVWRSSMIPFPFWQAKQVLAKLLKEEEHAG